MNTLKINDTEYDMSSPSGLEFRNQYITSFGDEVLPKISVNWNHIDGFYLNLKTDEDKEFLVKFFDKDDTLLYETTLKNNMYSKLSRKYYNGIRYEIYYESKLVTQDTINFKGKRVYIAFDSSSLGDTISWVPYCEEFRKVNECELIVSTFYNYFFESTYNNKNERNSIDFEDKINRIPDISNQKRIFNVIFDIIKKSEIKVDSWSPSKFPVEEKTIFIPV